MVTFHDLRARVRRARNEGGDRLWILRSGALERFDQWLDGADELPAVGRLAGAAGRIVERRLDRLAEVPVESWDDLNAKQAIAAVRELDRAGLRAARRRESLGKNRKTVLRAIDDRLGWAPEHQQAA